MLTAYLAIKRIPNEVRFISLSRLNYDGYLGQEIFRIGLRRFVSLPMENIFSARPTVIIK